MLAADNSQDECQKRNAIHQRMEAVMHWTSLQIGLVAASMAIASAGCSMCDTANLCDYATVGGKWQRGNPSCGRVGSTLSDAGTFQSGRAIESHSNFGDSWGIIESNAPQIPTPSPMIDGESFPTAPSDTMPDPPQSSSIMIGPG